MLFIHSVNNIAEIVASLKKNLSTSDEYFPMIVRRGSVLATTLNRLNKPSFDPSKKIKVYYIDILMCDYHSCHRWNLLVRKV